MAISPVVSGRLSVAGVATGVDRTMRAPSPASDAADGTTFSPEDVQRLRLLEGTFRDIYTQTLPELNDGKHVVVGVTSAIRGDGRTTMALGLALAIARDLDLSVLLTELDLERPALARVLDVPETPGLVDLLTGEADLRAALHRLPSGVFDLLPAGGRPRSASRVLRSSGLHDLIRQAGRAYAVTILDLPPALSSDVVPLTDLTDAVLVTARAGVTPVRLVDRAVSQCRPDRLRGVVLNGKRSRIPRWLRLFV